MNKINKFLKSNLKKKVKITKGLMIAFAITGILSYAEGETSSTPTTIVDITINNVHEDKGIELGDNSRARGEGSIATGRNSIAIGKNAVATGNNETKETIENKLRENRQKLDEIADKEKEVVRLSRELEDTKIRHRETIEAGIRVEQIRKSKENAKKEWDRLKQEYETSVNNSAAFFRENQAKIDDLNSRLAGLSQIQGVDISSEEGLNHAAGELKRISENGTNLNLTLDFYKDYVNSYYRALGDLRENEIVLSKSNSGNYYKNGSSDYSNNDTIKNGYLLLRYGFSNITRGIDKDSSFIIKFESRGDNYDNFIKDAFNDLTYNNKPTKDINSINHNTDIVDKAKYDEVLEQAPKYKESFKEYFRLCNDRFLTDEAKEKLYEGFNLKTDYKVKQYEIAYYQGEYERTKNTTWLDKKKLALKELENIKSEFNKIPQISQLKEVEIQKFKKEKINDIKEKNKITTDKLTSELETALGINKNAILEKQKELNAMKAKSDQAETNYNSINPSEKDLILAREYEALSREIAEKGQNLKTASERLKYLRDNLTLNDLTNKGSDSIAFGTNTIASGNSSIAFGKGNISTKENAVAIGNTNLVDGTNSVAIGTGNNVLKDNSYVLGSQNTLNKSNVYIIGSNVDATDIENAVVLGNESKAVSNAVSIGKENGLRKLVYLEDGEISENSKEAINGSQLHEIKKLISNSNGAKYYVVDESIIEREYFQTPDHQGHKNSFAIGVGAKAKDFNNIAIGNNAESNDRGSISIGGDSKATGYISTALGNGAKAEGRYTTAIGGDSQALGDESISIGGSSKSKGSNSVAIGNGSVANANYEVSFGNDEYIVDGYKNPAVYRKLTHISGGLITENSHNAVTGGQVYKIKEGNADSINKAGWQATLGDGKNEANNTGLINGSTLNKSLEGYIKKDGSNIDQTSKEAIISKLSEGADVSNPTGSVITDNKLKEVLEEKNYVTNSDIENKANKDLSNVEKSTIIDKVGNGDLTNTNGELVKDTVIKNYLTENYYNKNDIDKKLETVTIETKGDIVSKTLNISNGIDRLVGNQDLDIEIKKGSITKESLSESLKTEIDNKANKDASNIETDKYIEKLSKGSDISNPTGKLVKDIDVKKYLDEYNPNGSNLDKFMENIDNKFKVTNAGIAQALAMANTITNKEEKEHTISAGVGYYGNEFATAISYSTHQKNVGLKVSASLDSKLKFGLGAGISYTFGRSKTEIKDPVIKTIAIDDNYKLQEENEKLKEKITMLEDKFNSLNSKLDNINKEEKTVLTGYETNKYVLTDIQKEYLNLIVPKLLDKEIEIIGYTDTVGSDKYNLDLGIRRAEFVKNYLESKGITNISIKSAGFNITLNQNDSIDSKAENRRVEIIVK